MIPASSAWVIARGKVVKAPRLVRAAILSCTRASSAEVAPMWAAGISDLGAEPVLGDDGGAGGDDGGAVAVFPHIDVTSDRPNRADVVAGEDVTVEDGPGFDVRVFGPAVDAAALDVDRSEEHTSELQSRFDLVC